MLPSIADFKVKMFDKFISDVHSPIEFEIIVNGKRRYTDIKPQEPPTTVQSNSNDIISQGETALSRMKFKWSQEIANGYKSESGIMFDDIKKKLEDLLDSDCINQKAIDSMCNSLNSIFITSAKEAGAYCEMNKSSPRINKPKKRYPWMDQEAHIRRKDYYRVKNKLKRLGLKSMCNKKAREFKKFMKAKKKKYHDQLNQQIRTLRSNNSKEYWDLLNRSVQGNKARNELSLKTLMEHFKKLSQCNKDDQTNDSNFDDLLLDDIFDSGNSDPKHDILNVCFDVDEVFTAIRKLKNHKSSGIDLVKNEFLKNAPRELVEFMCKLFNVILETGFIPDVWCKGLIMPLYKNRGIRSDPDNYRGITLLSCVGKLFTSCLSARIADFMYSYNKMGTEQAGFSLVILQWIIFLHSTA